MQTLLIMPLKIIIVLRRETEERSCSLWAQKSCGDAGTQTFKPAPPLRRNPGDEKQRLLSIFNCLPTAVKGRASV